MNTVPNEIVEYYKANEPLVCELDESPYICEFWPFIELMQFNSDYEVQKYAPGYFAFGTSGGGEMFTYSPSGKIVCLAFIGMSPDEELFVADTWRDFENKLRAVEDS
jgi:hypothetical protein